MTPTPTDWQAVFEVWLAPFLARLGRVEQRRWAPVYLQGLLVPGERKSVEPMAARGARRCSAAASLHLHLALAL
jgi:SRSO17 transposase